MMINSKLISGIIAIGIYIVVVDLVFYYFGYKSHDKPKHYVTKNTNAISVSIVGVKSTNTLSRPHKISKPKPKPVKYSRSKPAKTDKAIKKIRKTAKKIKPKSLFANVSTKSKQNKKAPHSITNRSSKGINRGNSTIKNNKQVDRGIEDRYLAMVQNKLYGWPSQSNFVGAVVVVGLIIHPNGSFEYEILQPSDNPEFNQTIKAYLDQLGSIGFDPTPAGKKYKYKVEIKAK